MSKEEIINIMKSQTGLLREKYHVKNLGVFGSVVRGKETEQSDIDVLVEFESPVGFFEFIRMENDLSKMLGKKVDLITKKAIKPAVKEDIFKEVVYV